MKVKTDVKAGGLLVAIGVGILIGLGGHKGKDGDSCDHKCDSKC